MMKRLRACALALAAAMAASCNGTNTSIAPITYTPTSGVVLQLAVGTLNDTFGLLGAPGTYLNVVTTFRQSNGLAAYLRPGNAMLTGPGISSGVALGSLYDYGQNTGVNFTLGEPPAFPGLNNNGGWPTGYILTGLPPTPGTYTITTSPSQNGKTLTYTASATLPASPVVLPPMPNATFLSDHNGGGTVTLTNPPGVTESLVFFQATNGAYVASVEIKSPATSTTVPDGTLTVGATYYVFALGADYPLVESGPPNSTSAQPALTGATGTADLTTSGAPTYTE